MDWKRLAWWFLLVALIAILAMGFYLGVTHQEPRPDGSAAAIGSPG